MHLYLHVPFCARRCSYCDFAIAVRRRVPSERYAELVLREWESWQAHPAWDSFPGIDTIYFGGGTPSLLDPPDLERILAGLARRRAISPDAELTIEANPDDVTPRAAAAWRGLGLNRVSLGAQSFDARVLRWMHRTHSVEDVPRAVAALRDSGFANLSLDLIFGLPAEVERDWPRDLSLALALAPEHLSLYGLTVEAHTPLAHWMDRGAHRPVDEDRFATEFLTADRTLTGLGFQHYEVSNYAVPGKRSQHNSAYWRRAPYIGLGPSAHSGLDTERRWNLREWAAYEQKLGQGEQVIAGREMLDPETRGLEDLYLGLRTSDGVPAGRIPAELLHQWIGNRWATADSSLTQPEPRARLTPEGWLRMDALVQAAAGRPVIRR